MHCAPILTINPSFLRQKILLKYCPCCALQSRKNKNIQPLISKKIATNPTNPNFFSLNLLIKDFRCMRHTQIISLISFYHHAKNQENSTTNFRENSTNKTFLKLNPLQYSLILSCKKSHIDKIDINPLFLTHKSTDSDFFEITFKWSYLLLCTILQKNKNFSNKQVLRARDINLRHLIFNPP